LDGESICATVAAVLGSSSRGPSCIDEQTLADFAEGGTDARAHGRIEAHLADCVDCRAVFTRAAGVAGAPEYPDSIPSCVDVAGKVLPAGTRVGRYVIESLIGRGAMGAVYAADDPDLNRMVAVKVLRAEALSDTARQQMRARLLREAQAMARLSHPDVIAVYDVGAFGEELFVAMEYVEGETLRRWCADRQGQCSEILSAYERAGSGLAAAHEAGLVHRDFKPDNVLVGHDGRVRVTDFGLARSVDGSDAARTSRSRDVTSSDAASETVVLTTTLTHTGALLGTPAYMAPEQLHGGAADARSDVFSFCVALHEALYGERPFAGATVHLLLEAVDQGAVRAPPILTRVPSWIRAVMMRGLHAAPEDRYPSMRALLDALHAARESSRRRGRTVVAAASGLGIVLATALLTPGASAVVRGGASLLPSAFETDRALVVSAPGVTDVRTTILAPAPNTSGIPSAPSAIEPPGLASAKASRPMAVHRAPDSPPRSRPQPPAADRSSSAPLVGNNGALILE
jgi:tRNA A-37 threonylcarbamoyl transferase component Bud32